MNITILTDNPNSWILPYVEDLKESLKDHDVTHLYSAENIQDKRFARPESIPEFQLQKWSRWKVCEIFQTR